MGVLDDAIRQHLELKRQHGAPEEELQRQEEEALGPARRDVAPAESAGENGDVELEDAADGAAEAAPVEAGEAEDAAAAAPAAEAPATAPDEQETMLQELPSEPDPGEEPDSAADHEPLAEEPGPALYDAAADMPAIEQEDVPSSAGEAPAPESADAEDAHRAEAFERPPRADEELHPETVESPAVEDEAGAGGALEEEPDAEDEEDLFAEDDEDAPEGEEDPDDVLEDTPDFLQETPEHDRLWFEQKPPRDFDFD
jgi:hypothetical protein